MRDLGDHLLLDVIAEAKNRKEQQTVEGRVEDWKTDVEYVDDAVVGVGVLGIENECCIKHGA